MLTSKRLLRDANEGSNVKLVNGKDKVSSTL